MLADETKSATFSDFFAAKEAPLRQALTGAFGSQLGREAAADALAYGWEHWDRVSMMDNPAGYLFRVGMDRARRTKRTPVAVSLPDVGRNREVWFEPGLASALDRLSLNERTVVCLVHGYQWTLAETAELLGVSRSTVQSYAERGTRKLRRRLGVRR